MLLLVLLVLLLVLLLLLLLLVLQVLLLVGAEQGVATVALRSSVASLALTLPLAPALLLVSPLSLSLVLAQS